jgi:hypothetical protein
VRDDEKQAAVEESYNKFKQADPVLVIHCW